MKSLQLANDENLDDLGIDQSSDDQHSESANNQGDGPTSPPHDLIDLESGEDDPHMGGLEFSFNSSMYLFEDPALLTDHSSSLSVSRLLTPTLKYVQRKLVLEQSLHNIRLEELNLRHARPSEQSNFRITE